MENRIDLKRPDAPELAAFGTHPVGVRTLHLVNPGQIDLSDPARTPLPRADRSLVVEYWYPAREGAEGGCHYATLLRDGHAHLTLQGSASRGAPARPGAEDAPLVVLSHGHPGNRHLMAHLGEHLASHGYRVAAIDHADGTYGDESFLKGRAFASTLYHRPRDTEFVAAALGGDYAVVGYSMGGYGALLAGGAGLADAALAFEGAPPGDLLQDYRFPVVPTRLRALITIGPWGRQHGFWTGTGLGRLRLPLLVMAGALDGISGYQSGMRQIFEEAGGPAWLLTYLDAGHNAAAPIPAPSEAWAPSPHLDWPPFAHYADPVWDSVRMNNIAQHFATAFLGMHLRGEAAMADYLAPGWKGFAGGDAPGLRLEARGA